MKLLYANQWIVDGYDDSQKKWKFLDIIHDNEEDREICVIGRAKYVDREQRTISYYRSSGDMETKPLT